MGKSQGEVARGGEFMHSEISDIRVVAAWGLIEGGFEIAEGLLKDERSLLFQLIP
jgi:hypothetical protein